MHSLFMSINQSIFELYLYLIPYFKDILLQYQLSKYRSGTGFGFIEMFGIV